MVKTQRIRDTVHNLIEFDDGEFEQTCWRVLNTRPMQRLRRIKQLGFSEFVYPGACHSRFAHSVGVFHTARQLAQVVRIEAASELVGRTRLQKTMSLLEMTGLGYGFPFDYYKFGPYSEDLVVSLDRAIALGYVEEIECRAKWGGVTLFFAPVARNPQAALRVML
jgi:hypothetical protein